MRQLITVLDNLENYSATTQETAVKEWINANGLNTGAIMNALRLAIVGEPKGPGIFEITELIGKKETTNRIRRAIENINAYGN